MSHSAKIELTSAQQDELERRANSRTNEARVVERAKIIPGSAAGKAKQDIAEQPGTAANGAAFGKAISREGDEGTGRRAAVGTAPPHRAGADCADRAQDDPGNSCRLHPLEHTQSRPGGEGECLVGGTDLAVGKTESASGADIQAQQ